jgi:nucleoside-diphosphate-sugar epimerase
VVRRVYRLLEGAVLHLRAAIPVTIDELCLMKTSPTMEEWLLVVNLFFYYAPHVTIKQKTALVLGGGGFIGNAMVARLKQENYWVRAIDLKYPEFSVSEADHFIIADLRKVDLVQNAINLKDPTNEFCVFDEIYQFAADMGGAGFIFTGDHDAEIMHNSVSINLNVLEAMRQLNSQFNVNQTKIFYSSSACIYPEYNQLDPDNPNCEEESAYPANPDSEYGWEKLFSERLYFSYSRNYNIPVAVARYHNIYGPLGTWDGGREKAPAAICRKIAKLADSGGEIEVWGDGLQTRSFLYIEDCINATRKLMQSNFSGPVNIGSEEMVTIIQLVEYISKIASKQVNRNHKLDAPLGVRGRNSDNRLIEIELNWKPEWSLTQGLQETYAWISDQVRLAG